MRLIDSLRRRLHALLYRDTSNIELNDELRFHLDALIERNLAHGMTPQEARKAARAEFGSFAEATQAAYESRGTALLDNFVQDFRYGLRGLRKSPTFFAVAVLTLALGIGANTAMFSVIDAVLLRPLPYPDSDKVVQIYETDSSHGYSKFPVSPYNFVDWKKQASGFSNMAAYEFDSFTYRSGNAAERMAGAMISADFFRVLGVTPALGRDFELADEDASKPHLAILSYGAWQRRFGGDRRVVGRTMTINGVPYTIIAIMPSSFVAFPSPNTEIWALRAFRLEAVGRGHHGMFAIGRLKPDVSLSQAQSQMDTIARRLAKEYPDTNANSGIRLTKLHDEIFGPARSIVILLGVAVGIILLITCANLAGLLLGRVMAREREIGIRMALGARRGRIVRQVFTESIVLALVGGTLGIATAYLTTPLLVSTFGRFIPRPQAVIINHAVLLFSAFVTILCGFLFGMMPAFVACSQDIPSRIGQHLLSRKSGKIGLSLRRFLVIAEVGLALALLIAAGVMFKSMWLLYRVDPGFDANNLLTFRIQSPASLYPTDIKRVQLYQEIVSRLAAIPGVQSAGSVNDLPFSGSRTTSSFEIENMNQTGTSMEADRRIASPGYFRTMGIPLRLGRSFTNADNAQAPMVAIVNEALARKYLTDKSPLDQHLSVNGQKYRVVGVIGDLKHDDLTAADFPEIYLPLGQATSPDWTFVAIRYQGSTAIVSNQIRSAVAQIAPDQPIFSLQTMNERLSSWFAPRRFSATIIGAFTVLALILAAIGMYGVISYFVTLRTQEFGIRIALGATATDILGLVLSQALAMTSAAMVLGVLVSLSLNRLLSSLLYGVKPADPFSIAIAILAVVLVAFSASYGPAHRAAEVDPIVALRYE